jgi:chromosome segregation ATPase
MNFRKTFDYDPDTEDVYSTMRKYLNFGKKYIGGSNDRERRGQLVESDSDTSTPSDFSRSSSTPSDFSRSSSTSSDFSRSSSTPSDFSRSSSTSSDSGSFRPFIRQPVSRSSSTTSDISTESLTNSIDKNPTIGDIEGRSKKLLEKLDEKFNELSEKMDELEEEGGREDEMEELQKEMDKLEDEMEKIKKTTDISISRFGNELKNKYKSYYKNLTKDKQNIIKNKINEIQQLNTYKKFTLDKQLKEIQTEENKIMGNRTLPFANRKRLLNNIDTKKDEIISEINEYNFNIAKKDFELKTLLKRFNSQLKKGEDLEPEGEVVEFDVSSLNTKKDKLDNLIEKSKINLDKAREKLEEPAKFERIINIRKYLGVDKDEEDEETKGDVEERETKEGDENIIIPSSELSKTTEKVDKYFRDLEFEYRDKPERDYLSKYEVDTNGLTNLFRNNPSIFRTIYGRFHRKKLFKTLMEEFKQELEKK